MVGADSAFANNEGSHLTLHIEDTLTDTSNTFFGLLDTLDTIKIGDKYYIMTGGRGSDRGFQVLEITDPTNINAVGNVNGSSIGRNILDVNFHQIGTKTYALIASQRDSLIHMIDVTDPTNPTRVSTFTPDSSCNTEDGFAPRAVDAIQMGDHHYALATSQACDRFVWVNITDVTAPTLVFTGNDDSLQPRNAGNGVFTDLDDAKSLFFRQIGSKYYAYIGGSSGIQVVDITNASKPVAAGREGGLQNEPHAIMHYQVGTREYLIASIASTDNPEIRIHDITGPPVYPIPFNGVNPATPDRTVKVLILTNPGTNLQDFDIFEMEIDVGHQTYETRTYLALSMWNRIDAFSFLDITDPARAFEVTRVTDGTHGFSLLNEARDASAIKIGDVQYVAVGGTEGITLMNVTSYRPHIEVQTTSNVASTGNGVYTATLGSGVTDLSLNFRFTAQPPADHTLAFYVQKFVYQNTPRSLIDYTNPHRNNTWINFTDTNWNQYQPMTFTNLNHNWDREDVFIMIRQHHDNVTYVPTYEMPADNPYMNASSAFPTYESGAVIHVTGSSQSSPTQEEGVLRLPTRMALSLSQSSVGEGVGTVNITATLDAPAPPDGASVSLYSSGGNATEGTDYTLPASIYIAAGERSGSVSITISDDAIVESNESATISAYVDILGQEMTDSITLTIADDDTAVVEQDNRIPTVSAAIANVTIPYEGGTKTISLSGVFSDADNDSLNITASSSDATKASVSVASDYTSLTLTGKAKGIATITVTADDGNGGTVSDVFTITVKAAPTVSSAISDISGMSIGDNQDISLDGVFRDADNDSLNVTASTSDYNIAEAIIFQDTLTIIAVGNGSATITVTAQDTDGNGATDTFEVAVGAQQQQQQNRAPTISAAIANVTIPYEGGTRTISLSGVFSDADNDSLNVTATSSDATKASVSVASDYTSLTLSGKARGTATITVTADDGNGGTVSDAFTITVKAAPTVSSAISDVSGLDAGDSRTISLAGVFDDADSDSLVITAASSNDTVATVEAASDGSALTLTAQAPGTATITVTAQDTDGNGATDTFEVAVGAQQQTADTSGLEPIVAQYDTDGSGAIEQDEWEVAVEDHANGKLTNEEIFAISKARSYN